MRSSRPSRSTPADFPSQASSGNSVTESAPVKSVPVKSVPVESAPRYGFLRATLALLVAGAGALAAINAIIAARVPPLGPRLGGQFDRYPARYGDIAYTVGGSGAPILLLHGLDAGRSMAEWRAVFEPLCEHHTVYAFDFQGYGLSDTTPEGYNAQDFAAQVSGFTRDVIGEKATILSAGESAVPAILAARECDLIEKIALICPTAPDAPSPHSRAEALALGSIATSVLNAPIIGLTALNWWRSLSQLRKRAREHGFYNKDEAEREARLWHLTAHQKGAARVQKAHLQDAFAHDWRGVWEQIRAPALLMWGRNAMSQGFDSSPEWLALRPDVQLCVIEESMLFPHLEQPQLFCENVREFLEK